MASKKSDFVTWVLRKNGLIKVIQKLFIDLTGPTMRMCSSIKNGGVDTLANDILTHANTSLLLRNSRNQISFSKLRLYRGKILYCLK